MKLNERPFELVKSGKKQIEIRLNDEKRSQIEVGDIIVFSKLPDLQENIEVEVLELLKYPTFKELVENCDLSDFGYSNDDYTKDEFVELIYAIYTKEQEEKYGILGIRIKL